MSVGGNRTISVISDTEWLSLLYLCVNTITGAPCPYTCGQRPLQRIVIIRVFDASLQSAVFLHGRPCSVFAVFLLSLFDTIIVIKTLYCSVSAISLSQCDIRSFLISAVFLLLIFDMTNFVRYLWHICCHEFVAKNARFLLHFYCWQIILLETKLHNSSLISAMISQSNLLAYCYHFAIWVQDL